MSSRQINSVFHANQIWHKMRSNTIKRRFSCMSNHPLPCQLDHSITICQNFLFRRKKKKIFVNDFEKNCFLVFFFIAILYFKSQYLSSLFDFSLVSMSQIELFAFFSWSLYHPIFTRLMLNQMKLKR